MPHNSLFSFLILYIIVLDIEESVISNIIISNAHLWNNKSEIYTCIGIGLNEQSVHNVFLR